MFNTGFLTYCHNDFFKAIKPWNMANFGETQSDCLESVIFLFNDLVFQVVSSMGCIKWKISKSLKHSFLCRLNQRDNQNLVKWQNNSKGDLSVGIRSPTMSFAGPPRWYPIHCFDGCEGLLGPGGILGSGILQLTVDQLLWPGSCVHFISFPSPIQCGKKKHAQTPLNRLKTVKMAVANVWRPCDLCNQVGGGGMRNRMGGEPHLNRSPQRLTRFKVMWFSRRCRSLWDRMVGPSEGGPKGWGWLENGGPRMEDVFPIKNGGIFHYQRVWKLPM